MQGHASSFRLALACSMSATLIAAIAGPCPGDDRPHGIPARVPWTASRLVGSPEPPSPYGVEKTFTRIAWKTPIYMAPEPGSDRLWVVQAEGGPENGSRILRTKDDPESVETELLLEVSNRLIYSVCFHPDFATNGFVYVFSNSPKDKPSRKNQITRYTVQREAPFRLAFDSAEVVIEWKSAGHDGGDMAFGPDGMLYLTTGDGTTDSDAWNSGQTLNDLLGSVLRIDVNRRDPGLRYSVPRDNPFVNTPEARPEIWAYGLRNPWRMGADLKSGQIWVGNNGQDLWETAHLIRRGENYGWSVYEGSHPFYLGRRRGPTPIVAPTIEHPHSEFRSLTGGIVYRGERLPELDGAYIYGDHSSGRIWGMKHDGEKVIWHRELADTSLQITAFRVDQRGELLITDYGGAIYRLTQSAKNAPQSAFPKLLSETGLYASTKDVRPERGLIPYSVNAEGWNDGAVAERFMAIPGEAKVGFDAGRGWNLPDGTALVQTLSREIEPGREASRTRIETRVLLRQQGEWEGYSYRWNPDQSDAVLVPKEGADGEPGGHAWRYPSRSECMSCHSRAAGFVLGVTGAQLNRDHLYEGGTDHQIRALAYIQLFQNPPTLPPQMLDKLINPRDASGEIERRARTYLHVNCSVCHVEAGGGNAKMELGLTTPREKMNLLEARPQHETFGLRNAMLVAPGEPDRSVLLKRLSVRGRGQMPPLVAQQVDEGAVKLMSDWIAQLKPQRPLVKDWQIEDFQPLIAQIGQGRSLESGRKAFRVMGCSECHRIEGEGGSVGPELSGSGKRLEAQALLESILIPSKVITEGYATHVIETDDGLIVSGRIEREDDRVVWLLPPPPGQPLTIEKARIVGRKPSGESGMPPGTVNSLQKDQVLDLIAYLLSNPTPAGSTPP